MPEYSIESDGLRKRFGNIVALSGLDMFVEEGQVHGFLGPNGAGKSTTIRVLLGLYGRDGGRVHVLGLDPAKYSEEINKAVSYVPGDVVLWPSLTGGQILDVLGGLRGAREPTRERRLIERFGLDISKRCRTYSKGNRQKVSLVAAFAARTQLLVLDEPTSGLDPLMEKAFAETVVEAQEEGRTILLSSHLLDEVQRLCSHVTIVKDGRSVESGDLKTMQALVEVRISAGGDEAQLRSLETKLSASGVDIFYEGHRLYCQVERSMVPCVLGELAGLGVDDVTCGPIGLGDLFLRYYEE